MILLYIFQQYTPSGRAIFAVGANIRSTRLAGVDTDKAQIEDIIKRKTGFAADKITINICNN